MRSWGLLALLLAAQSAGAAVSDEVRLRRMLSDSRFLSMVFPCTMGGSSRNSPSEWIRTAFHDAANHDAAAGTGGIDGSIFYETGYNANRGNTFTTTMTEFKFYQQDGVAFADLVALGATLAIRACGGPKLEYYYGRSDLFVGSGEGFVPEPEQTTETHTEMFDRMGFTPTEMIELVACGHTMGGVHAKDNPNIVTETYHHFDSTVNVFDNNVAIEFINDTRQNPLAQPYDATNPATSSDTRLFAVDNNATLKAMAASNDGFLNTCNAVFSKMFNEAVPSSVALKGPLTPYPVSGTGWFAMKNGVFYVPSAVCTARLWNMVGQWQSFEIGYRNRDGSVGTDSTLIVAKDVKETNNGWPIEFREFSTNLVGFPPATGVSSIMINVKMNDGTMYSSAEGEEEIKIDDTLLVDTGNLYTCKVTAASGIDEYPNGFNISVAVLGPYNEADKVEAIFRTDDMEHTYVRMSYRGARDAHYNIYNAFIPDRTAYHGYGAQLTRADGSYHKDAQDDRYFRIQTASACIAGAEVPAPAPTPSSTLSRRTENGPKAFARKQRAAADACPSKFSVCDGACVDTKTNIEHCGGCAGAGGRDCTQLSNGFVACIKGKCVLGEEMP